MNHIKQTFADVFKACGYCKLSFLLNLKLVKIIDFCIYHKKIVSNKHGYLDQSISKQLKWILRYFVKIYYIKDCRGRIIPRKGSHAY